MNSAYFVIAVTFLTIAPFCSGQAAPLECSFAASSSGTWWLPMGPAASVVSAARPARQIRTKANAVLVGMGFALTSTHCVQKPGMKLTRLLVGRLPARVLLTSNELALLATSAELRGPFARARTGWDSTRPATGERLSHLYVDHAARNTVRRAVTWTGASSIAEGFAEGMSGSGLYDADGFVVGVAEWTTGHANGPLDLAILIEESVHLGIRCFRGGGTADRPARAVAEAIDALPPGKNTAERL